MPVLKIRYLYKYLKREHARAFMEHGTIRVGTLRGYRPTELGQAIGDAREGTSETRHAFDGPVDVSRKENRSWVVDRVFQIPEGATNVVISNLSLVLPEEAPDCYIYCLSHRYARHIMRAFEADACIRVDDPAGFLRTVSAAVVAAGYATRHALVTPCDYSGRDRDEKMERIRPALLKDPTYEYQAEIRMLWPPARASGVIEPFFIDVPRLATFCSMLR